MIIAYNEIEKAIEIKDDLKNNYFFMKFLMVLNLLNALLRLLKFDDSGFGVEDLFWFAIGIISLVTLYIFLFKRSTSEKIKIDQISRLKEKTIFGRKRFALELVDGKQRNLNTSRNKHELAEMKKLFVKLGLTN